jgi:quercetin dioxygenase-like cupin family protein
MITSERGELVIGPEDGESVWLGGLGVDFKIGGTRTGGGISVVEHPIEPRRLVPPHLHRHEDELSYVLEGVVGVRIGDEEAEAGPGSYVFKPRDVPHTFWNPTDQPARILEIITPAGFERFFAAMGALDPAGVEEFERNRIALGKRFGLEFLPEWVDDLRSKHGLRLLGE